MVVDIHKTNLFKEENSFCKRPAKYKISEQEDYDTIGNVQINIETKNSGK